MLNHFLSLLSLDKDTALTLVKRAMEMKKTDFRSKILANKTIILIFEKASTRTRVSFETGIRHLGGETIFMTPAESQLGRSEPVKDTARVLSRYCDGLVVRTFKQEMLTELVQYGTIPVINALTDSFHPCQVMSDMLTIYERTPDFSALKVAWVGDGNNMAHSFINAAVYFPFSLHLACPKGYEPDSEILEQAKARGAKIILEKTPEAACENAHYINTDVWASMGQEEEQKRRERAFANYQVNNSLVKRAHMNAKIMHCLPAHRGEEITESVLEGPKSIVFDQAENRLHMQKALLEWVFA